MLPIEETVLSAFVAWSSGRDPYTGRDLWDEDTLEKDKWVNLIGYMANLALFSWMPGGYDYAKVKGLLKGEKDWATRGTKDWRWELAGLVGMATTPMDVKKFYKQATVRISHKKEEIAKQRRIAKRALLNREISVRDYEKRIAYLKSEYEKLQTEVRALGKAKRIALEKGIWHLAETD